MKKTKWTAALTLVACLMLSAFVFAACEYSASYDRIRELEQELAEAKDANKGGQGEKGDKGDTGAPGAQGEAGEKGDAGKAGMSAYDIWLSLGNEGGEADFLEWLKGGPKGDAGAQGLSAYQLYVRENPDYDDRGEAQWLADLANGHLSIAGETRGLEFTLIDGGKSYEVSRGRATAFEVVIPAKYEGKPVTAIAENGFRNYAHMIGVDIPDGVLSIGENAFRDCVGLTHVDLPDGVADIGGLAFYGCSLLKSVGLPAGLKSIGRSAFQSSGLTGIELPVGVVSIGASAFRDCAGIKNVELPSGLKSIGESAFNGSSLAKIFVPSSVETLGGGAALIGTVGTVIYVEAANAPSGWNTAWVGITANYWGVSRSDIAEINGVQYVLQSGNAVLARYSGSDAVFAIPSSATINGTARNVTRIGFFAFGDRAHVTNVLMPSGIVEIGAYAFDGCTGLSSITIPSNVTKIGAYAFYNCTGLTIYAQATSRPDEWDAAFGYYRPVVWRCTVGSAGGYPYVTSLSKADSSIANPNNRTLNAPYAVGYTFGGWYGNSAFTGDAVTAANLATAANGTYYAKWNAA